MRLVSFDPPEGPTWGVLRDGGVVPCEALGAEVPLPTITLHIDLTTNVTGEPIEKLQTELPLLCAIARQVRVSGAQLTEIWNTTH